MMNLRPGAPSGTFLTSYFNFTPLFASVSWMELVWVHEKNGNLFLTRTSPNRATHFLHFAGASNLLHPSKTAVKKTQIWWMKRRLWAIPCFFFSPLPLRQNYIICIHARTHSLPQTPPPSPDVDLYSCLPVCLDIFHDDLEACKPDTRTRLHERAVRCRCPSTYSHLAWTYMFSRVCSLIVYIDIFKPSSCLWAGRTL